MNRPIVNHSVCLRLILLWTGLSLTFVSLDDGCVLAKQPNVLFIAIDDLRPALGCYDDTVAVSPNIDAIGERGTIFRHAYCQLSVCSPSRLSLMSGRRPDTIRVWDLKTHFRKAAPDIVTLPQHFKNHGYHTQSIGKIFHGNGKPSKDPPSWSADAIFDQIGSTHQRYALPHNRQGQRLKRASTESADVPDGVYLDGIVCDQAERMIRKLGSDQKPFFLAVGFRKPHLPFCAPKKYWDLYQRDEIPLPDFGQPPGGAPELAIRSWKELEGYEDIPNDGALEVSKIRELRHGYYACVSYIDALIGRLTRTLTEAAIADNTVILLWGDHGYHLGEQGLWTKANNYELATRVPLIISVPGFEGPGQTTDALVELVDVYPTLAEVCGLPIPDALEGTSLCPLITQPDFPWKPAAFSQYPRDVTSHRHRGQGDIMGYALRTRRYRYVEWRTTDSDSMVARELYDHQSDSQETQNVEADANYKQDVERLARILANGFSLKYARSTKDAE